MSTWAGEHAELGERAARILDEVERAVVGKRHVLELVLLGLLADGHVLIEDNPGLAKTLMARSFAAVTGLRFARVQFTPDLMPSDVTGSAIYDQRSGELRFQPGPIFTHVLLGDEINRAPPKTQAALLEAMQERQVTTEDRHPRAWSGRFSCSRRRTRSSSRGPIRSPRRSWTASCCESASATRTATAELELLARRLERGQDEVELDTVVERDELLAMQRAIERVHADAGIRAYAVDLVAATRESSQVQIGASPRGTLALLKLARAKRRAARARLRHARRRQAGRGAGARASDHAASRALDPARRRRGRGARLPRQLPSPAGSRA